MFDVVVVILLVFIGFGWSFDRRLPKIELHSHLHGSVRLGTLVELATVHDSQVVDAAQLKDTTDPFDIFKAIHALVDERAAFERIFDEMVDDLFADGTVYAEIRTTPRALKDLTREDYVAVLVEKAVRHNNSPRGQRLQLRLILSINRANSLDEAMSLVKMVQTARQNPTGRIIVGIDFSGNPLKSDFGSFLAAFRLASRLGLSVTIHSGEDERLADEEMGLILDYLASSSGPSRLGHAVHIDERHVQGLLTRFAEGGRTAVPLIEIPPTSNMFTLKLDGTLSRHPTLGRWLEAGFPVAIAVDDSGVFNTTLTQEMTLVRDTFKLDDASMVHISPFFPSLPRSSPSLAVRRIWCPHAMITT